MQRTLATQANFIAYRSPETGLIVGMNGLGKPKAIVIDRAAGLLRLTWLDGHASEFSLRWLRAHCPCATCREARRAATLDTDVFQLSAGPLPSTEIANAQLVGNYALRLAWSDGHATGIYPFAGLRASCPCTVCHPAGPPARLLGVD